ncbi:MAG: AMP-binding protein, partial [Gammaproteobacteria bacterium]|nr:AMP-binding protein [Gammaproteobacteria bacterium]
MKTGQRNTSKVHDDVAIFSAGTLDRATFWNRVHGLKNVIQGHSGRRWALLCEDSSWFAAGFMALANCRRLIVLPQSSLAGAVGKDHEFDLILSDHPENYPGLHCINIQATGTIADGMACFPDDDVRVEFHTSGSTGSPKCVPKAFAQLRNEVQTLENQWGASLGQAVIISTVPHHHLYGLLFRVLWPLLSGRPFLASVCLHPDGLRNLPVQLPKIIVSSPAFLSRIDNFSELPPAAEVAAVFSSGAPLPDETAMKFVKIWGRSVTEVYGSTETGGIAWRAASVDGKRRPWRAFSGVELDLRQEPSGDRLWVKSPCTWQSGWMATGDLARIHADGGLELLGRSDDVIKIADKRVSLGEIRIQLAAHTMVADARLVLVAGRRSIIGAVVILNASGQSLLKSSGKKAVCDALRAWLRE